MYVNLIIFYKQFNFGLVPQTFGPVTSSNSLPEGQPQGNLVFSFSSHPAIMFILYFVIYHTHVICKQKGKYLHVHTKHANLCALLIIVFYVFFFKEEVYSLESSQQLLEKDIVQLHAPRYQYLRKVCNISVPLQMSLLLVERSIPQ